MLSNGVAEHLQVLQEYEEVRASDPTIFSIQVTHGLFPDHGWLCIFVSVVDLHECVRPCPG